MEDSRVQASSASTMELPCPRHSTLPAWNNRSAARFSASGSSRFTVCSRAAVLSCIRSRHMASKPSRPPSSAPARRALWAAMDALASSSLKVL